MGLARGTTEPGPRVERAAERYAVKAVWRTLQGEGAWAGRPAVFVRFVGCNMWTGYEPDRDRDADRTGADCPRWCDTDFTKENALHFTAGALAAKMQRIGEGIRFCVLTGGEPLLQADAALIRALRAADFEIAIETNGTIALADAFSDADGALVAPDWIVCSPKLPEDRLTLEWCDELKLVVPDYRPDAYARFAERVRPHAVAGRERRYLWLQPEDGGRLARATRLAVETALAHPAWRVSVQTHKILDID